MSLDTVLDKVARIASARYQIVEIVDNASVYNTFEALAGDLRFKDRVFARIRDPEVREKLKRFCEDFVACSREWEDFDAEEISEFLAMDVYFEGWRSRAREILEACDFSLEAWERERYPAEARRSATA